MSDIAAILREIVGDGGVLSSREDCAAYDNDLTKSPGGAVACVVRPRSTAEVSAVLAACSTIDNVAVIPRGGGTGLAGGATPPLGRVNVVLSLERMRAVRAIDPVGNVMTVEAGCSLHDAQAAAVAEGRLLGLDHGGASSQIGGNLATNAGGNNVLRYGMARDQVLGLEVVLADGQVLTQLSPLRKNNAGYDLKQVFLGSEGTLGIITAAALRLRPAPRKRVTACVGLTSLDAVLTLFARAQAELGESISAFEVMSRAALDLCFAHSGQRAPFDTVTSWTVLLEADSASEHFDLSGAVDTLVAEAMEAGLVADGTIAASEAQRQALWALREGIPSAMIETPGSLKSDTAVPIPAIAAFDAAARHAVAAVVPDCVPAPFGHVGDGNIHFNVLPPPGMPGDTFSRQWPALARAIEDVALSFGGTVSAEHGIGLVKRDALSRMRSATELAVMRSLKQALDPRGLLNPGKIL
ncbi:MAG: FAD-binding oxidoreductase [Rhizobiales bacterium]|nr:FAD-binding oxidoreductase [Hyphomicrobiales bacterium]OJY45057.1 MAG: FAD-dependent oxidoreductase [Rhizobiales bacterium 64-17]